ncbi:hypothetical protein AcW1_010347 [Taiwanofungus camphoratus]|nr:hypothetical protein AcW1_010347 [Antrodia cinnamomea]
MCVDTRPAWRESCRQVDGVEWWRGMGMRSCFFFFGLETGSVLRDGFAPVYVPCLRRGDTPAARHLWHSLEQVATTIRGLRQRKTVCWTTVAPERSTDCFSGSLWQWHGGCVGGAPTTRCSPPPRRKRVQKNQSEGTRARQKVVRVLCNGRRRRRRQRQLWLWLCCEAVVDVVRAIWTGHIHTLRELGAWSLELGGAYCLAAVCLLHVNRIRERTSMLSGCRSLEAALRRLPVAYSILATPSLHAVSRLPSAPIVPPVFIRLSMSSTSAPVLITHCWTDALHHTDSCGLLLAGTREHVLPGRIFFFCCVDTSTAPPGECGSSDPDGRAGANERNRFTTLFFGECDIQSEGSDTVPFSLPVVGLFFGIFPYSTSGSCAVHILQHIRKTRTPMPARRMTLNHNNTNEAVPFPRIAGQVP